MNIQNQLQSILAEPDYAAAIKKLKAFSYQNDSGDKDRKMLFILAECILDLKLELRVAQIEINELKDN